MQSYSGKKVTTEIAFISGKGGSGKSGVCIAMGYMLVDLGFRVGIVDCDISTHGITYFFVDHINQNSLNFSEPIQIANPSRIPVGKQPLNEYLYFVPSVVDLNRTIDKVLNDDQVSYAHYTIKSQLVNLKCDFILYDCQAGFTTSSQTIIKNCDYAIIVTEADPLSIWAVNSLYKQMELSQCIPKKVFGLVNKIMPDEEEYYNAIVDVTRQISFLNPLPFDKEVRRAFFRREIPINLEKPNSFVIVLGNSIGAIDKKIEDKIKQPRHYEFMKDTPEIQADLEHLEKLLSEIEDQLYESKKNEYRITFYRRTIVWAVASVYILLGIIFGIYEILSFQWSVTLVCIGLLSAILFTVYPSTWLQTRRGIRTKSEIAKLEKMIQSIQDKIAELEILKRTQK